MASLKEIKGRIASVKTTLKTTSAMKLVASAKLRKAQGAVSMLLPYQQRLSHILSTVTAGSGSPLMPARAKVRKVAIVAFASNSSLCGAFNSNAVRLALETVSKWKEKGAEVTVFSVGRKMYDSMRRAGYPSPGDYSHLADKPSYQKAADLAASLSKSFGEGEFDRVELVYNHFVSTARQEPVCALLLPLGADSLPQMRLDAEEGGVILEPSREELLSSLVPKVMNLKLFSTLLDSSAAEHAARTVAMQAATDNGESLLEELTLEYNKGRQQKITSEILDIVGGSMQ